MNTDKLFFLKNLKNSIAFELCSVVFYWRTGIWNFFGFFMILLFSGSKLVAMDKVNFGGDTTRCPIELELEQLENGDYQVSLISDTTWNFPENITSTAQITLKAPSGNFTIGSVTNLIDGVIFFETGRIDRPAEAPDFDYISIGLGTQGTSNILYQKGVKVALFSINNTSECTEGIISLMDNFTDPFVPPNMLDANVGQQITVSGFGEADVPIAVRGMGILCNSLPNTTSDIGLQIVKQDIHCYGQLDALIIAKADGGEPSYHYLWNTGDTLSTITGLSSGTYSVTVTDANGDTATAAATIIEPDSLILQIVKQDVMPVGENNGTATPAVSGGTPPYQFAWSNNSTDSMQVNLSPGDYALTVTDINECTAISSISIGEMNCPTIDVMMDISPPICVGDSTGSLRVTPLTGSAPFSFLWETGDTSPVLDQLFSATYMVTVIDARGCTMAVSALLPDAAPITIELVAMAGEGIGNGMITSIVEGGMPPYAYLWSNGSEEQSISGLENGVYELTITDDNGCMQIASAIITTQACDLGVLDDLGTALTLDSINCAAKGSFCLSVPLDSLSEYSLLIDGMAYSGALVGCEFDTLYAYTYFTLPGRGDSGPYILNEWTVNGVQFSGAFQNIQDLVDSLNFWDPGGNWNFKEDVVIIQGGLPSNTYGKLIIRHPLTNSLTTLDVNTNLTPNGTLIEFESGTHEVILIRKTTACSDTLKIEQPCATDIPIDTLIVISLKEGENEMLCLEEIFGTNPEVSANQCPELSGENASILLISNTLCINIEALLEGTDEACFSIIDNKNRKINLTLRVNVQELPIVCESFVASDTIFTQSTDCQQLEMCFPLAYDSLLTYSITNDGLVFTGLVEFCNGGNGSVLAFTEPGIHQLVFRDIDNCLDTVIAVIACDEDIIIGDTIEVGDTNNTCISLSGIPGTFQTVQDLCPEQNGEMVLIDLDGTTGCLTYTGIELGVDTACIEVCDQFGFCDTVIVVIAVTSGDLPPPDFAANDDSIATNPNDPVVINVLANDVFTNLDTFSLVNQPDNGIAVFNSDGTLTYSPITDYCNDSIPEQFLYEICVGGFCDTAKVMVTVQCTSEKPFTIYTGLSPNGDGINDVFLIEGIENFPNNSLQIFNRWGNQVYIMDGYKNEWDGTWREGQLLPDGTYFYLLDDGEGQQYSGWLEIRR